MKYSKEIITVRNENVIPDCDMTALYVIETMQRNFRHGYIIKL